MMELPKIFVLIGFIFILNSAHSQDKDFSLKWLGLLENDWPDFERKESKEAAHALILELQNEIRENKGDIGHYNYILCEINYYLNDYDSSIYYGNEALRTHFSDSSLIYKKLLLNYQHKDFEESEIHQLKDSVKMIVDFFGTPRQIRSFFIIDQRRNYSVYFEKHSNGTICCEGQFDPKSLDSVNFFYDTICLFDIVRDGTVGYLEQKFPVAKSGIWNYYYENGVVQMSGNYTGNKRNGEWIFYDPSGKIDVVRQYNMGEIVKDKIIHYYIVPPK